MSVMTMSQIGVLSAPLIVGEWPCRQDLATTASVVVIGAILLWPLWWCGVRCAHLKRSDAQRYHAHAAAQRRTVRHS